MLLAIDIGNTNTVFALCHDNMVKASWRCKTESARSADEYAVFLKQLFDMDGYTWKDVTDVIISSVVPDINFHIDCFSQTYLNVSPIFITADTVNIKVDLDNPEEVGADRLISAVAIIAHYTAPAIVVDFGTATTFDVIDEHCAYAGGAIAPGIRLSINALTTHAAKLPQVNIEKPKSAIGRNTLSAMQSGLYWGYVGLIESLIHRISNEMTTKPTIIATGGLASLYARDISSIKHVDDTLILKGLIEVYKQKHEKR